MSNGRPRLSDRATLSRALLRTAFHPGIAGAFSVLDNRLLCRPRTATSGVWTATCRISSRTTLPGSSSSWTAGSSPECLCTVCDQGSTHLPTRPAISWSKLFCLTCKKVQWRLVQAREGENMWWPTNLLCCTEGNDNHYERRQSKW